MATKRLGVVVLDLLDGSRPCRPHHRADSPPGGGWRSIGLGAVGVCLLQCLASGPLTAQQLSLGGRVGFGAANAVFQDSHSGDRIDPRPAPLLGGTVAYELSSVVSLHAELLYTHRGWAEFQTGGGRRLYYLQVPLLLGLSAPWRTTPHLLVGPSIGFELGCAVTDVPDLGTMSCEDPAVAWDRAKVQYGVWIGLGLGRRIGSGRLDLQLLGDYGFTDMNREPIPIGYLRFANVMLSASYRTTLGGS